MHLRPLLLITTALIPLSAHAGPNGANVVGGAATVSGAGTANVTINQTSDRAIINWNTFNIGVNEKTTFVQPDSGSIALNRVTGGLGPSEILGSLSANGRVFVVNRDGIIFGPGATINTAGFLATTNDIRNSDFMAGKFNFSIPGRPDASITNMGTITAASGGFAALVAPGVRNSGTITANLGTVTLASGNTFNLDFYGDKLITLGFNDAIAGQVKDVATGQTLKSLITNDGKIKANGGRVELTAAAARQVVDSVINTSGVIEANSVGVKNGQIVLSAATASTKGDAPVQTVRVAGKLSASGHKAGTTGGKIVVTGENIQVAGATIKATGRNGGGTVLIGGDWGGGKPNRSLVSNQSAKLESTAVPTATTVSVDAATTINASAKTNGDGGKVVLWSDQTTNFAGTVLALGGSRSGNGGFAEVSSHGVLNYSGVADLRATNGSFGSLLLDPYDVTISNSASSNISGTSPFTASGNSSVLNATTLTNALALANVFVTTGGAGSPGTQTGNITVDATVSWNAASTLTLSAYNNISFNSGASINNTGAGSLILRADNSGKGSGYVSLSSGQIDWSGSSGAVSIYYTPVAGYTYPTYPYNYPLLVTTNSAVTNQLNAYMLVNTDTNLQNVSTNLAGSYALGKNIDTTGVANFAPIGSASTPFTGKFDGLGNTISNLNIAPTSAGLNNVGLFGAIGLGSVVQNFTITNATVSANPNGGSQFVGVLAALNSGTISNVTATNSTVAFNGVQNGVIAGGLVGQNQSTATIANSSASTNVTVGNSTSASQQNIAGGLVGVNNSTVTASSAGGNIAGGSNSIVGGLVGQSNTASTISNSNATGNVTITGLFSVAGGLLGAGGPGSAVVDSRAAGTVTSTANGLIFGTDFTAVGGLVGTTAGTISGTTTPTVNTSCSSGFSCATGDVSVGRFGVAGGLVGLLAGNTATVTNSFATGAVTGAAGGGELTPTLLGGLAGENGGTITSSHARGAVGSNVSSLWAGGLVGTNGDPNGIFTGTIVNSLATGNVTVAGSSYGGGLVGANTAGGTVTGGSAASGTVAGSAPDTAHSARLGGLVGYNLGAVTNSSATGAVNGGTFTASGGLVGVNLGSITFSNASTIVTAGNDSTAGGAVGSNGGAVSQSTATGDVTGADRSRIGGLVGRNVVFNVNTNLPMGTGTVTGSSASGNVSGGVGSSVGGLVGWNPASATITNSSATGNLTALAGGMYAGGLVGQNDGTISNSTRTGGTLSGTGTASQAIMIGGLAGTNSGTIQDSSVTGTQINAQFAAAGGLVGYNTGMITGTNAGQVFVAGIVLTLDGANSTGGGLVGKNDTGGTIHNASAGGIVTTPSTSTDQVTLGGLVGWNIGAIDHSIATAVVTGTLGTTGGFAGQNDGTIDTSTASGNVGAAGAIATFANVGGFVGVNSSSAQITNSSASGNVTGGVGPVSTAITTAGGFVGTNSGIIDNSSATGAVTGGGTSAPTSAFFLTLGGFAGSNDGTITNSFATGPVTLAAGTSNILDGTLGGFVGMNSGTISKSYATGAVGIGGNSSFATLGGFAGTNEGTINTSYATGTVGDTSDVGGIAGGFVGTNFGGINNSYAIGSVTTQNGSAGGFAGTNFTTAIPGGSNPAPSIMGSYATGNVTGGGASLVGGFTAFNLGAIATSHSTGNVSGGDGSFAGGFTGLNAGTTNQTFATGAVTAGAGSFVGGFVGLNVALDSVAGIALGNGTISQSYAIGAVTGGPASFVGGFSAINTGAIDQAYATGLVTAGIGSTTGGFAAANSLPAALGGTLNPGGTPTQLPTTAGTATNSYWDQTTTGQAQSAGGAPMTTAQLTSAVPTGFSTTAWSSSGGNYPCLNGACNPAPVAGQPAPANPTPPTDPTPPTTPTGPTTTPTQPTPPTTPQTTTNDQPTNTPTVSPLLNLAVTLVNNVLADKKQDDNINLNQSPNGGAGSSKSGGTQNGASGAPTGNAGRPPVNTVPPAGLGPLPSGLPPINETRFASNEVVMQLGANFTPEQIAAFASQYGLEVMSSQSFGLLGRTVYRFRIIGGLPVRDAIVAMQNAIGSDISVQPSYHFLLSQTTSEPASAGSAPADTNRQGDSAQYIVTKLGLTEAHSLATGKGVKVAVIDSEIDIRHPDLAGAVTGNYDALPSTDTTPHPHGTGMAGAIGSHQRLLGIAPAAQILGVRAFGVSDAGAQGTSMNIVKGLEWAVEQGAQIINMSFAGPHDPILEQAISELRKRGIILIAAAGNAGPKSPPLFPGADKNVIGVSATDQDDRTFKGANRGPQVAIAAPGVDILVPAPEGGYQLTTGTSVAAAHISGVVALMLERNPRLTANEVRNILIATAKKLPQGKNEVGAGLVDPVQAIAKSGPKQAAR